MSPLSEMLENDNPRYIKARLEATFIALEEVIKLLTPEQQDKLNNSLQARLSSVKGGLGIDYQLSLLIKE